MPGTRARTRGPGRRLVSVLVLATTLLGVGVLQAAAAEPPVPSFPSVIEGYPRYESEAGCDPTAKPGAQTVVSILQATYGAVPGTNISRGCTASSSGHEEGRSVDWMTNSRDAGQREKAQSFLSWLLATDQYGNQHAMARRLGISYVIWDSRKLYLWNTAAGWTEYSNCLSVRTSPADDNYCHRNHVHISMTWAGAWQQTSWWTLAGDPRGWCPTPATPGRPPAAGTTALGYTPVEPARLMDTRTGEGSAAGACWVAPRSRTDLQVAGRGGVPSSGVGSVVLNVTATDARGPTWVAAYPAGATFGGTSSVNVVAGGAAASLVTVPLGTDGKVSLATGEAGTDLVVDVVGYYGAGGALYTPAPEHRLVDQTLAAGSWTPLPAGVPSSASAVVANVTMDDPDFPGHLSLVPGAVTSGPRAATSSVNVGLRDTAANRSLMPVVDGSLSLYSSARTRGIVDVSGYFAGTGSAYRPLTPARIVDTRNGMGGMSRLLGGQAVDLQVGGRAGVPAGATAAVMTITSDQAAVRTHLTAWAKGTPQPVTSDLNIPQGSPRANMLVLPLDAAGTGQVFLNEGSTELIVDVLGYYVG